MGYRSLKQCVNDLERQGQLVRLTQEIDARFEAAAIHRGLVAVTNACFKNGNPSTIRYVLRQLGVEIGAPRLPVVEPDAEVGAAVMAELRKHTLDALVAV